MVVWSGMCVVVVCVCGSGGEWCGSGGSGVCVV